jgi:hypothetical protein
MRLNVDAGAAEHSRATPVSVSWRAGRPVVEWTDFRDLAFTDPFFADTYDRLLTEHPEGPRWETDVDVLLEAAERADTLDPSGFIFHMGRCGSTLVSRLLATSERALVVAEPDPLIGLLDFPDSVTDEERCKWLRALVTVLGRRRRETERRYFLKLTSFHVLHLDLMAEVFPTTPWVYVVRDPGEVMRSVVAQPTGFALLQQTPMAAARYLDLRPIEVALMEHEEFVARFLARMLAVPLAHEARLRGAGAIVVDYRHLPTAIWETVAPFFGLVPTSAERAAMAAASGVYSKDPTSTRCFQGAAAPPEAAVGDDVLQHVEPATCALLLRRYRELQALEASARAGSG